METSGSAGSTLSGNQHSAPLQTSARTLRRYVADVDPVRVPDSVIVAMRRVCVAKLAELQDCIERLDAIVPPTPAPVIHAGVDPEAAAWFLGAVSASMVLPPGTPTFVRDVLAVRVPARGRLVQADVVICDGSTFTLEIDRQRAGDPGHVRFVTDDDMRPRLLFDDEAGVWRRDPDRPSEPQSLRRAAHHPTPKPAPAPVPAPARDPRQVDLVEYIEAAKATEG